MLAPSRPSTEPKETKESCCVPEQRKRDRPADYFADWKTREALAEAIIPLVGMLYRERNVKVYIYGRSLIDHSVTGIMKAHRHVRELEHNELSEFETHPMLSLIAKMNLGSCHVDLGRLAAHYMSLENRIPLQEYLRQELGAAVGMDNRPLPQPRDVVLYGFGRIGRLLTRLLVGKVGNGDGLRLRAVVTRKTDDDDLRRRVDLLRRDSVHGSFPGTIRMDEDRSSLIANGNEIKLLHAQRPGEINYAEHGIQRPIVIDNTGAWRNRQGLAQHLEAGAEQVVLTAPGKDFPNIVHGINEQDLQPGEPFVSAASCTTNAIALPLKVIHERFGIEHGHVETVHAYTNDQNLIDNYHKRHRRGRSAPLNMVITTTGAVQAVAKVLPELAGRLTGNSIRVPVANVSVAVMHLHLGSETTVEELNGHMHQAAVHSSLHRHIDYTNSNEAVSTDFIGSRHACVYDSRATIVQGRNCAVYIWYDNEFGYACQVHRVLESVAGVRYALFPQMD